jgi:hypothetical protein
LRERRLHQQARSRMSWGGLHALGTCRSSSKATILQQPFLPQALLQQPFPFLRIPPASLCPQFTSQCRTPTEVQRVGKGIPLQARTTPREHNEKNSRSQLAQSLTVVIWLCSYHWNRLNQVLSTQPVEQHLLGTQRRYSSAL